MQPIGYGTVLSGLSGRSQARMIDQIARALFATGAAERVITVMMTKDRAHMHLDTVFTMLEPGVVVACERNTNTIVKMREAGVEVVTIEGFELGKGARRRTLHDLPAGPRPALEGG